MKKILKIFLYATGILLLVLLLIAGATQTQFFRDKLRAAALTNLEKLLDADVRMGDVRGNLVTGFAVDSVAVVYRGVDVIRIDELRLRYNLLEIPGRTISVSRLALIRPVIHLLRSTDGRWNVSAMVRPAEADSTPPQPFSWAVIVSKLSLIDGTVVVVDSAALAAQPPLEEAERRMHNFTLHGVNLTAAADVAPGEKHLAIAGLSFVCTSPDIRLSRLAGDFLVTPDAARVTGLTIVTSRSNVALTASLEDVDLLGGMSLDSLRRSPVSVDLQAHNVDLNELKSLIPELDFLKGSVALDLVGNGDFGDVNVRRLDLQTGKTRLSFKGKVSNLHAPRNLTLNVQVTESKIFPADVRALMPSFDLPGFPALGVATLNLEFEGRPLDFRTKFLLETEAGNVRTEGTLKIGGPATLRYSGDFLLQHVNLAGVLEQEPFASSLNGTVHIEGEGVRMGNLNARLQARLEQSELRGIPLEVPSFTLEAGGRKLTAHADVTLGEMASVLTASLDEQNPTLPAFAIDGRVSALNLATLLHDRAYDSDITLGLNVHGTGLSWGTLGGDFLLDFSSSRYRDYRMNAGAVHLKLDQTDTTAKHLSLESDVADLSLTGAFDLEYLTRLVGFEARNLRGAINDKFAALDSSLAMPLDQNQRKALIEQMASSHGRLDAEYSFMVKDLEPVSAVAGKKSFNGAGVVKGSIRGDYQDLSIRGQLDVADFFYGDVEAGTLIQNASATFVVNNLRPDDPLRDLNARLSVNAAKAHINSRELDSVDVTFAYQQEYARYSARARLNRDMTASVQGQARVAEDTLAIILDELLWTYQNFAWHADSGAAFRFDQTGASLSGMVMRRDTQSVSIAGTVGDDGRMNVLLDATHINLDDLKYFITQEEQGGKRQAFTGVADVQVRAGGMLREPDLLARVRADQIAFRGIPFGSLHGTVGYRDRSIEAHLDGGPIIGRPSLTITGTLPLNLTPDDSSDTLPEQPMNLVVHSAGVEMSILDPLLPTFNQLSGNLRCDLTIAGTPRHPAYGGNISITGCSFLFVPNNIQYSLEGNFMAQGERLKVLDAAVHNVRADERGGRRGQLNLSGDLSLRDLVPGDFNLSATGQLLVVKETTRQSALSVYGDLFVEIGPAGLHFTGEIERSLLKGSVFITNSSLVFPPTAAAVNEESPLSVPLVLVDDTTHAVEQTTDVSFARYFAPAYGNGKKPKEGGAGEIPSRSFLDGVHYDLDIETAGGNAQIQMIFNPTTNEELVASLEGTFSITEDGRQWFGDLTINRAYYNFFKRFDAEGKIRYTGDFLNPELDITGSYKGVRVLADSTGRRNENIVVTIKITGSRLKPKIEMSMTIDGDDYYNYSRGPKSNDVESDAIAFILAGSFPLTSAEKNQVAADVGSTVSSSLVTGAASPLTGVLSDFLRNQVGFINSVELSYGTQGSSVGERADIRLSGTAWNGYWRYGGKILDDPLTNANFSILYSFGTIFNNVALRNLMFELERRVETGVIGATNDFKRVNSARLFYRFSF